MSFTDFSQTAEDHQALLILVKQIGPQITQKSFNKVFDRITRVQYVKIQDSSGARGVWLRYKKTYPVENNEWGDFQSHRKVLGLLCVGKRSSQADVEELCRYHNIVREKYSLTLYDSRCLVFGADLISNSNDSKKECQEDKSPTSPDQHTFYSDSKSPVTDGFQEVFGNSIESVPKSIEYSEDKDSGVFEQHGSLAEHDIAQSDKPRELSVHQLDSGSPLQNEKTLQHSSILFTPNDAASGDGHVVRDSSLTSIGSINSSTGSPTVEGSSTNSPACSRKTINLPSAKSRSVHCILYPGVDECDTLEQDLCEFASSLFWVLESKRLDRSFEKQDKIPLLIAPFEKKEFIGVDKETRTFKKRCIGRMRKHIGDLALQAGIPLEALSLYSTAFEILKSINDWLWIAAIYEGQCASSIILLYPLHLRNQVLHRNLSFPVGSHSALKAKTANMGNHSRSLPNGIDPSDYKSLGKGVLSADNIVEKYKEAVSYYRKNQNVAVIETECSIKATRVMILQEKYLEASEFLQNAVFIDIPQSDEEKMQKFYVSSELYSEIGFHRKAAFYKRCAAIQCATPQNPNPNWAQSYNFLLQTLDGYKLSLDAKEFPRDITYGCPRIQIQILQDLVGTARKMGNQPLSVRLMTLLLHSLSDHLTPNESREFCAQLESLTANCEGGPVPLALDNGMVIPPVNLLNLPSVKSFKLQNLAPHLRPVKMASHKTKPKEETSGLFIFSPLQQQRDKVIEGNKLDFKWVEGDVCEVALQVFNPLPFELKVAHMGLQADGIAFESFPACLSLPAESGPYPVNLLGTPQSTGELQVLGYTTHVLGVKSNCRLKDIPSIKKPYFAVDVIPRLPQLQVTTSLPKANTFSSLRDTSHVVISAAVTLHAGESRECTITLTNSGKEIVESIDISLQTKLDKAKESAFFTWSKQNLETQLPILPDNSASFTLYINALGEFVHLRKEGERSDSSASWSKGHGSRSASGSLTGTPNRRKPTYVTSPEPFPPQTVEAVLQLQYTGGPGMAAKYCRQCAVAITVEVLPSVLITKWDVLPAEVPTHCYLVLDMLNCTNHEMELQYAASKCILIEARETCRIPVPVERCPLRALSTSSTTCSVKEENNNHSKTLSTEAACRQHLVNLVDLKWSLPAIEVTGRASVAEVTWTAVMLNIILMSPIQWDIFLNDKLFKAEEEFCFTVGELLTLSITISNLSDTVLCSLYLSIQGYQSYQNGRYNYHLENRRAVVGSDKVLINEILPHESYCHECGFVFFHTGVYKLNIQCSSSNRDHQGGWPATVAGITASHLVPSGSSLSERREVGTTSNLHRSNQNGCIWKCTPTIEITIVDE